mgnify:CR=1 FL=1
MLVQRKGMNMGKVRQGLLGVLAASLAFGAGATDIYRWVDENGRTHLSDVVPERYRDTATRVDSRSHELTPEQRREARERAAGEAERTGSFPAKATAESQARGAAASPDGTQPAPAPTFSHKGSGEAENKGAGDASQP